MQYQSLSQPTEREQSTVTHLPLFPMLKQRRRVPRRLQRLDLPPPKQTQLPQLERRRWWLQKQHPNRMLFLEWGTPTPMPCWRFLTQ